MTGRLVTMTAAATALLGTLLSPPAAASSQPAAAASSPPAQDCTSLQLRAAGLLAAGQTGNVACLEDRRTHQQRPDGVTVNDFCPRNSGFLTRSTACNNADWRLNVRQIPSGAVVGWIDFSTEIVNRLNYNSLQWTQQFVYTPRFAAGAPAPYVTQTLVEASPSCVSACQISSLNPFLPSPAMPPVVSSGTATFQTSGAAGARWNALAGWRFRFTNPNWLFPMSNEELVVPPQQRCDNALSGLPAGCVYTGAEARHDIASLRYPKYARHIGLALGYGLDNTLTRTTNPTTQASNRQVACGGREGTDGWSCDEYPFASTLEGAASQPYGRTFLIVNWQSSAPPFVCNINHHLDGVPLRQGNEHSGYSVCMIPLSENTGGGSDLGNFYYTNRVLDGDGFTVRVV